MTGGRAVTATLRPVLLDPYGDHGDGPMGRR